MLANGEWIVLAGGEQGSRSLPTSTKGEGKGEGAGKVATHSYII